MFQMQMLHFLRHGEDPIHMDSDISTLDFYYTGKTYVMEPQEIAICVLCVAPFHTVPEHDTCQLKTRRGWDKPHLFETITVFVLDHQGSCPIVIELGSSFHHLLTAAPAFKISSTQCQMDPQTFFQHFQTMEEEEERENPYEYIDYTMEY